MLELNAGNTRLAPPIPSSCSIQRQPRHRGEGGAPLGHVQSMIGAPLRTDHASRAVMLCAADSPLRPSGSIIR